MSTACDRCMKRARSTTMTERNTARGSQPGEQRPGARTPPTGAYRPDAGVHGRGVKRADPTEPEVSSAKRVLAVRRQRSLVVAGSAFGVLLAIVVFLLYKTGRHVTTWPAAPTVEPLGAAPVSPPAASETPVPAARTVETAPSAAPPVASASSKAPAGSKATGSTPSTPHAKPS